MPVLGQIPTRIHLEDSATVTWTASAAYPDPNDPSALVRDVQAEAVAGGGITSVAGIVVDGAGSVPDTGSKGYLRVPFAGTITAWTLLADQSGSAQITVKKCAYGSFPTTASIVAAAPPSLSSQQNNTSSTLTGWTTSITAGDVLEFVLDSVTTCTRLVLELEITRS